MDWLLAALALFNVVSMITVFSPRAVPRRAVPWALFLVANWRSFDSLSGLVTVVVTVYLCWAFWSSRRGEGVE